MKVCMCRDFDEAAARRAIENGSPENPENVHELVKGEKPNCGACLTLVQAMIDRFNAEGTVPKVLDISREERAAASAKLTARFTTEEPDRESAPHYKQRYMPRGDKPPKPR